MKRLLALLMTLVMLLPLVACGDGEGDSIDTTVGGDTTGGGDTTPVVETTAIDLTALSQYGIYYSISEQDNVSNSLSTLFEELKEMGYTLGMQPTLPVDTPPEDGYEILLGNTGRAESTEALESLRYNDFLVRLDGNRIVLAGHSVSGLMNAVNYFLEECIDTEGGKMNLPVGEGYIGRATYAVNNLKIADVAITDYKVLHDGSMDSKQAAAAFVSLVQQLTGYSIESGKTNKDEGEYNIIVSNTVAGGTTLSEGQYSVSLVGKNVVVNSYDDSRIGTAAKLFLATQTGSNGQSFTTAQEELNIALSSPIALSDDMKASVAPITIYVSTDGDDRNLGTYDAPFATMEKGLSKAKEYVSIGVSDVCVYFRGGDYSITDTVELSTYYSGTEDARVVIAGAPGEQVRFVGGVTVSTEEAKPVTDQAILDRILDSNAKANLHMLDLSPYVDEIPAICDQRVSSYYPVRIFVNDTYLEYARWPNEGTVTVDDDYIHSYGYLLSTSKTTFNANDSYETNSYYTMVSGGKTFTLGVSDAAWARTAMWDAAAFEDLWVFGYLGQEWIDKSYEVVSKNDTEKTMELRVSEGTNAYKPLAERRYYFFNVLEEIDIPGECYIDRENLVLYFLPTEDSFDEGSTFSITTNENILFSMLHTNNFGFKDVTFCVSRNDAFKISNCDGVFIEGCEFYGLNRVGVITQSKNITFSSNDVYSLARGGIQITKCGDPYNIIKANILLTNNHMYECNDLKRTYASFIGIDSNTCGVTISHNTMHDAPQQLMEPSGSQILIEYNEIYDVVNDSDDAAAIYTGGSLFNLGVVIRYNYFHDIGNEISRGGHSNAIYFDCEGVGGEIYGNVFVRAATKVGKNSASAIYGRMNFADIYNNIFVDTTLSARVGFGRTASYTALRVLTGKMEGGQLFNALKADKNAIQIFMEVSDNSVDNWYDVLVTRGFFTDTWREYYKGTTWEAMWELFDDEHFADVEEIVKEVCGENYTIASIEANIRTISGKLSSYAQRNSDVNNRFHNNISITNDNSWWAKPGTKYSYTGTTMYYDNSPVINDILVYDNYTANKTADGVFDILDDNGNSIFVDAANRNYTLTEAGLAWINDQMADGEFKNIDMSNVGCTRD